MVKIETNKQSVSVGTYERHFSSFGSLLIAIRRYAFGRSDIKSLGENRFYGSNLVRMFYAVIRNSKSVVLFP